MVEEARRIPLVTGQLPPAIYHVKVLIKFITEFLRED